MSGIMNSLLIQARKASQNPSDCRRTIDTLRAMGFGEDAFGRLHHQNGNVARFYAYSEGVQRFVDDGNNHRVHQRLMYVLLSCPNGAMPKGKSFLTLAEEAYQQIPPHSAARTALLAEVPSGRPGGLAATTRTPPVESSGTARASS
jgi:hypothetical protein